MEQNKLFKGYSRSTTKGSIETILVIGVLAVILIATMLLIPAFNRADRTERAFLALAGLKNYRVFAAKLETTGTQILRAPPDVEIELLGLAQRLGATATKDGVTSESVCAALYQVAARNCATLTAADVALVAGYQSKGVNHTGADFSNCMPDDPLLRQKILDAYRINCDISFRYVVGVKFLDLNGVNSAYRIDANLSSGFPAGGIGEDGGGQMGSQINIDVFGP